MRVLISLQLLCEAFLMLTRILQNFTTNVDRSTCKVDVILVRF